MHAYLYYIPFLEYFSRVFHELFTIEPTFITIFIKKYYIFFFY